MVTINFSFCWVSCGLTTHSNTSVPRMDQNEDSIEEAYVNLWRHCKGEYDSNNVQWGQKHISLIVCAVRPHSAHVLKMPALRLHQAPSVSVKLSMSLLAYTHVNLFFPQAFAIFLSCIWEGQCIYPLLWELTNLFWVNQSNRKGSKQLPQKNSNPNGFYLGYLLISSSG